MRWVSSLAALEGYCTGNASLAARMALLRARVVAGGEGIAKRIRDIVRNTLRAPWEADDGGVLTAPSHARKTSGTHCVTAEDSPTSKH